MEGPDSAYSCLLIHICWKVDSEARMEPPIHTEYLRSGGAMILIFIMLGARVVIFCILSAMPGYMVSVDVHVTFHDGVKGSFMDATRCHAQERRLEERLRAAEMLVTDGDDLIIGQPIALLQGGAGGLRGHLLLEVQGDVAQLLLDVTHNFPLSRSGEAVAALGEDLHEVVSQVPASQVQTQDGVGEGIPLIDGHSVGDPVTGVHHDASVGLGIQGGLSKQHGVLLRSHTQLIVESVVPDLLHVVPVGDNAVLDGVLQGQDATLAVGLVTHVGVLLTHAHYHALVPGAPHDGGEDGPGSIVTHEASFAHAGAVVDNECSDIIIHGELAAGVDGR
ncbi:hypothetical protein AAY473_000867 [Plecturocebus cupreus]